VGDCCILRMYRFLFIKVQKPFLLNLDEFQEHHESRIGHKYCDDHVHKEGTKQIRQKLGHKRKSISKSMLQSNFR